eukprot:7909562-Alexandrium_andersonii.AAC.1
MNAFFFRITHAQPHRYSVPRPAVGQQSGQMGVVPVQILELDRSDQSMLAVLGSDQAGEALDTCVLETLSLTMADLKTLRSWVPSSELEYMVNVPLDADM